MWGGLHSLYLSKDGKFVFFAALERKFWERFCEGIGRPELVELWGSDTSVAYGDVKIRKMLEPIFASRTSQEWARSFLEWAIPGSPVLELDEVMSTPHFASRKLTEDGQPGELPNLANPIRFIDHGGGRPGSPASVPPSIGQDTEAVLASWLGLNT
jgi:crotonobetainyl-CoA:carnitine CoA-transferase CaiB-like acyl-CoA transferase